MTPQEFIITQLNKLVESFPQITFKYTFEEISITHIVEVEPLTEFKDNQDYLIAEADLVYEFDNTCMPDTLLFVSEESITRVLEPDLIISSKNIGLYLESLVYNPNIVFKTEINIQGYYQNNYSLAA